MTSNFLYDFNFRDQPDLYDNTVARGHTERKSVGKSLAEGLMRPLRVTLTVASGCIHHLSPWPIRCTSGTCSGKATWVPPDPNTGGWLND